MQQGLSVRRMTRSEVDLAIEWAAREGWNPGLEDAEPFYAADPHGFFLGSLDGEPIGSISAVAYDDRFGFIGLYIVRSDLRGRGFGRRIWETALSYLGERTIGLDGVVAQQPFYGSAGFRLAYRNVRHEGAGGGSAPSGLVDLRTVPPAQLQAYDDALFPAPRPAFLRAWIAQSGTVGLGVANDGTLAGYGVVRPCRTGFKIGPLFADSEAIADRLFRGLTAHAAGGPLYLDTPEVNASALALAERYGMQPIFETARMYTKQPPALPHERIFGVTTFELG